MKKLRDKTYFVSFLSILLNIFLSVFKFVAGIIGKSTAMVSDSIHSLSDVLSTVVVIIGVYISRKQADTKHPYGHEKFESLSAIFLSFLLGGTGFYIGYMGISNIINKNYTINSITTVALVAAIISIIVKEVMYRYTIIVAKKCNSSALKADAWHHRSDSLSSIGALIGIIGSILGYKFLDPLASIIISLFIIKSAFDILKESLDKMVDVSVNDEEIKKIEDFVLSIKGVKRIDDLKTRMFGSKIYIDIEIAVNKDLTLVNAHKIAEEVHIKVEEKFNLCKHCMVHVNPL